jgi:hypothetical protein
MIVVKMTVEQKKTIVSMIFEKLTVDKMTIDKMAVEKMTVD